MPPNSALLTDTYTSPLRAQRGAAKRERYVPTKDPMNEFEEKVKNASDAVNELISFFVRCNVDWAKYYHPISDAGKISM